MEQIKALDHIGTGKGIRYYPTSRPPLLESPLVELPVDAVKADGWIAGQLDQMSEGITGRLSETSPHLADDNGWLGGQSEAWEEQGYWLRGLL